MVSQDLVFMNFQGCFTVQLSMYCFVFFIRRNFDRISCFNHFVNTFFIFFCDYYLYHFLLLIAFLMIRRRRDLNPRTARTVYTLSRGASSATWVLLHMPVSIFYTMLFSTSLFSCDARIIIFEIISFVNYFFTFFCHFFISSWKNPPKQCNSALHQSGRLYKSIY